MSHTIYSATGCVRCKITKNYLKDNDISFEEFDFKAEGKDAFNKFYRENRKDIFRDKDGVEFPVYTDGNVIVQGVSVILGHLTSSGRLAGYIGRSLLHGEWIDGFNVSGGNPDLADELITVLSFLKQNGLKIQLTSNGKNSEVLQKILDKGLGDRLLMEVSGPAELYSRIIGEEISPDDLTFSLKLAPQFKEYQFSSAIRPVVRPDNTVSFITPEEIGETAKMIEDVTGNKKHPYVLRVCNLEDQSDERFQNMEPLPSSSTFKYRTAARRYMVMTEIEK